MSEITIPMLRPVLATDFRLRSRNCSGVPFAGFDTGVGQPASHATLGTVSSLNCPLLRCIEVSRLPVSLWSRVVGVGQPNKIESLADMRAAEARSAQITRPEGVARSFQVSRYKIEPTSRARNLLSNDDWRAALRNEIKPDRPEVSFIIKSLLFACRAERLARARACPDWLIIWPTRIPQSLRPHAYAGKEMALREFHQFECFDFTNIALVNYT
jgi:hypothetical protein